MYVSCILFKMYCRTFHICFPKWNLGHPVLFWVGGISGLCHFVPALFLEYEGALAWHWYWLHFLQCRENKINIFLRRSFCFAWLLLFDISVASAFWHLSNKLSEWELVEPGWSSDSGHYHFFWGFPISQCEWSFWEKSLHNKTLQRSLWLT